MTVRDTAGPDGVIDAMTYGQLAERSAQLARALPRLPTGKLATRLLRDRYWDGHGTRIV